MDCVFLNKPRVIRTMIVEMDQMKVMSSVVSEGGRGGGWD